MAAVVPAFLVTAAGQRTDLPPLTFMARMVSCSCGG
jgi:hypothetical protein